ncbi:hypothetical protein F1188_16010 [Roseospira marina]|uniref:Uncharacterized protein n=1 Tax=Roseospira marina TaxID=140057 RepID=A0A5M6I9H2_9PROT|nr:hypothetical protein [Roseospira marina]KAA5604365.1 hypothetical protein F1188_16010 [Roseospira marina]MBB4315449.1 hypothetical protein [Roseospira marina]MBB5088405.1 hypothetical protein [Roseospira marina]
MKTAMDALAEYLCETLPIDQVLELVGPRTVTAVCPNKTIIRAPLSGSEEFFLASVRGYKTNDVMFRLTPVDQQAYSYIEVPGFQFFDMFKSAHEFIEKHANSNFGALKADFRKKEKQKCARAKKEAAEQKQKKEAVEKEGYIETAEWGSW